MLKPYVHVWYKYIKMYVKYEGVMGGLQKNGSILRGKKDYNMPDANSIKFNHLLRFFLLNWTNVYLSCAI